MTLGDLIDYLKVQPADKKVGPGFGEAASYRGYYSDVAFAPVPVSTCGEMLAHATKAVGMTIHGHKGGEYLVTLDTGCWVAAPGQLEEHTIEDLIDFYW